MEGERSVHMWDPVDKGNTKELESLETNVTLYHVKITWELLFVDLFLW